MRALRDLAAYTAQVQASRRVKIGDDQSCSIDDVAIGGGVIRLGQFLKLAGLLDSGGDVKEAIIDGLVAVNGEVDRRCGRQLQPGETSSASMDAGFASVSDGTGADGDGDHQAKIR